MLLQHLLHVRRQILIASWQTGHGALCPAAAAAAGVAAVAFGWGAAGAAGALGPEPPKAEKAAPLPVPPGRVEPP
jgi:hypothetical protein